MQMDKTLEELRYCYEYVQMVRGILFWLIEPDEGRDRKGLVLLAEIAKKWAEDEDCSRLTDATKEGLLGFCEKIIEAGAKSDGPPMPEPWRLGL